MVLMLKKSADRRQIEALEKAFQKADIDGDGKLSADEYYKIIKDHGINCTREEIIQIMQIADKNHDGYISKEEFLGQEEKKTAEEELDAKTHRAFNVFDKNHDGFVTKEEMLKMSKNLTKKQVDAVFERNDENRDGKLTIGEFQEMMNHNRKK